jgi:penicillin G amidase
MKIVKFLLSLLSLVGIVWALNTSLTIKGTPAPAFGKLLNPFGGFWNNGESLTQLPTDKTFEALKGTTKVVFDDRMVPHVFAENLADAYFVQGYLHAANRLWQMDFITRASGGKLSEVLGNRILRGSLTSVDIDKTFRRKGILAGAEKTVKEWEKDKETWALIQSYCAGANAHISTLNERTYPVEYKIFGVAPPTWTPLHMALFAKYMAIDLASGESDVAITNARTMLGGDFDFLFPTYFKEQSPIVPAGTPWGFSANMPSETPKMSQNISNPATGGTEGVSDVYSPNKKYDNTNVGGIIPFDNNDLLKPDPSNGSNNWVAGPSKTKNKKPILCGDPHLGLRLPSIWYEMQIVTPEMNVYGVSLPGLPAIIIGFNENIAWTQTNVGHDVADWYSIKWTDKTKTKYLLDGVATDVKIRIEEIKINGKPTIMDTVRYTVWGPVVYENDTMPAANMAYHWLANEVPESSIQTFVKLNKAKNYDEYSEAIKDFNVPAQNYAFACKNGDIALKVMGMYPKKAVGQGRFVQDGSLSSSGWKGFVPKDQVPFYKNPARGFVSSANQHSTDPSYPYFYHSESFEPYRGRIVNDFLTKMDTITIDDMKQMQNSNYSLMAEEALPLMLKNLDESALTEPEKKILGELKTWQYFYDAEKVAPIYFEEWYKAFYNDTWDEFLKQKNVDNIQKPSTWRTVFLLRDEPANKFFDVVASADKKETAKDILTAAFKTMVLEIPKVEAEIKTKYDKDPTLIWTHYKDTEVPHLSTIPGFGRSHLSNGGNSRTINSMKKNHGPSWRMIVEMGDQPHAFVAYPGGQSGNPGSPYYTSFLETWTKGEYYEALFLKKADEQNARIKTVQTFKKQ